MNPDWSKQNPLVVTGVGVVSPLGTGREATWSRLLKGDSAIRSGEKGLEARVIDFSPNGARSRMGDFALLAAEEALAQAGLLKTGDRRETVIGCAVGQSKPLIGDTLDPALALSGFFGWSADALIPRYFSLTGPVTNVIAACATGLASLKVAEQWLNEGVCDAVLAGAAEASLNNFYRAGFHQLGVLVEGKNPGDVRPFDRHRTGFAMGEGSAVMVIERLSHARQRGVRPMAILNHVVLQQSGADILRFDENGDAVARLVRQTMADNPAPSYINTHGTGTLMNDRVETMGLKKAFGIKASLIPVSSTKAATGHLLGAAGAVEAAFSVLALRDGKIPPTLNLETPDPECDLDYVTAGSRTVRLESTLSLSYGFGGQMAAVLFSQI